MTETTTPAVERAVDELRSWTWAEWDPDGLSRAALAAALDVEEITETLARTQWDSLDLVKSGELLSWDDPGDDRRIPLSDWERKHFRDRCRPFAEAVRKSILGEP
jgi:hypothetical protein